MGGGVNCRLLILKQTQNPESKLTQNRECSYKVEALTKLRYEKYISIHKCKDRFFLVF